MSQFDKPHILIPASFCDNYSFSPHTGPRSGKTYQISAHERPQHARHLLQELQNAVTPPGTRSRLQQELNLEGVIDGDYLEFRSHPGYTLKLDTLDNNSLKPTHTLLAVKSIPTDTEDVQAATVFVKKGSEKVFSQKIHVYLKNALEGRPKPQNSPFCDSVASIQRAPLRSLWTDEPTKFPSDPTAQVWWEIWLRRTDDLELQRLRSVCEHLGVDFIKDAFSFRTCIVTAIKTSVDQLEQFNILHDFLELRGVPETAKFFVDLEPYEQKEWIGELLERRTLDLDGAPAVCLLDTGITPKHPLLKELIDPEDCHAYDRQWGIDENHANSQTVGHGTSMAGLALYGDLTAASVSSPNFTLRHRLESVKIVCPKDSLPATLYPATMKFAVEITAQANPSRNRVFALATSELFDENSKPTGRPSSWSGALDALSKGNYREYSPPSADQMTIDDLISPLNPCLFVVAAGNAHLKPLNKTSKAHEPSAPAHPEYLDKEVIESPGQAWNVLTIGAYTTKTTIRDPDVYECQLISQTGELSPWSRTSVEYLNAWAIKPDVVFEGGNGIILDYIRDQIDDLWLLTTHHKLPEQPYTTFGGTSAATALAAKFCAELMAEFPALWPETIRALVIHSARWTRAMKEHFEATGTGKVAKLPLLRRYGYGVPDLQRALRCAANDVKLIAENRILAANDTTLGDIHLYELPWPKEVLGTLGKTEVRLRITLSYFIEPNASRREGISRYQYASHGLRFDVMPPSDSVAEFHARLNKKVENIDYDRIDKSKNWYLGSNQRNKGSVHSDVYTTTATELARQNVIAIYPTGGWWKELAATKKLPLKVRYSLVVSLETDDEEVDLWTPIKQQVDLAIATQAVVEV